MVDVILTSYNRTDLLKQAIESVLSQTYSQFLLHIIDDGSKEETRAIIQEYLGQDSRIIFYQTDKKDEDRYKVCDYAQNINKVIAASNNPVIAYLTCDDIYYPTHLEVCLKALNDNMEWGVVFTDQQVVHYDDATGNITKQFVRTPADKVEQAACIIDHNQVVMRRSILEQTGCWNEDASIYGAGDAAFWQQINNAGYSFYRVPVVGTEHRLHKNSVQSLG